MKSKSNILVSSLLLGSFLLAACGNEESNAGEEADVVVEPETAEVEEAEEEIELPEESQQVNELPWEEADDFKSAQSENDTDVLIAGFVTVSDNYTADERENINIAADAISGTVLQPGETFSQNETAGPYTEEKGYLEGEVYVGGAVSTDFGGGVCNVATTLYNTSIVSDLDIVERHNHSLPVPYVPYGQDAAVAYGYKDFQFKNNTNDPLLIWTEFIDHRLYMGFYGKEEAPEIVWEHETLSETETSTQYTVNDELDEGEENVLVEGMDGKVVHSILKIKDKDGQEQSIDLGNSSYNPKIELIERNE